MFVVFLHENGINSPHLAYKKKKMLTTENDGDPRKLGIIIQKFNE